MPGKINLQPKCVSYCYDECLAADALIESYSKLRDTGFIGLSAEEVAAKRKRVEELIDLPEYYQIEAETTERRD